jgi:hypothetical protein
MLTSCTPRRKHAAQARADGQDGHGCELPLDPPTDPPTRGIDIDIVCAQFFAQTPAKGNEKQKRELRQGRFDRAVERAQKRLLIGVREIGDKTYLWLLPQHPDASKF